MKNLRVFETTQQQESKVGSIDYVAVLLNNETGAITMLNSGGDSDTYTLRFTYEPDYDGELLNYFYYSSGNAPIAQVNPVVKIDGEVVEFDSLDGNENFAKGIHTIDFIINKQYSTIPTNSFQYCNFTNVIIPNNISEIGSYAFSSCDRAEDITIPSSVITIGDWAFNSVKHITYDGTATYGEYEPYWGAQAMN